jgi:DNA polymerase-3 subunit delta
MIAISNGEADGSLGAPGGRFSMILVFGPNRGLVSERSAQVSRNFLEGDADATGRVIHLSGDAIASDPLSLADEAHSIDMFQRSRRVVCVSVGAKSVLPALEIIARAPPRDCLILLVAGDLRRDAPLRKWAEMHDFAALIECRQDDARSLARLIENELATVERSIEPSARDALLDVLGEDRLATRNEIEKLLLYTDGKDEITLSDVEDVCYDPNLAQTDAIVDGFFSLKRQGMLELLLSATHADPTVILLVMIRHALALQRSVGATNGGANFNDALQSMLRSTGGYNRKGELMRQLKSCTVDETVELIRRLQSFTAACRYNPTLLTPRLTRLLISRTNNRPDRSGEPQ